MTNREVFKRASQFVGTSTFQGGRIAYSVIGCGWNPEGAMRAACSAGVPLRWKA